MAKKKKSDNVPPWMVKGEPKNPMLAGKPKLKKGHKPKLVMP